MALKKKAGELSGREGNRHGMVRFEEILKLLFANSRKSSGKHVCEFFIFLYLKAVVPDDNQLV